MKERLEISRAVLLVVDVQEAFAKSIPDFAEIVRRAAIMVQGCKALGIPVIATEQVPAKLGATAGALQSALGNIPRLEKTAFSACGAPGFTEQMGGRDQILLCGIETHICITQTALDLLTMNGQVHLLMDAIGSRSLKDHEAGLSRMFSSGVVASSAEMGLFELMRDSNHPAFRTIQKLVK